MAEIPEKVEPAPNREWESSISRPVKSNFDGGNQGAAADLRQIQNFNV
jgi:hypothetical protein